MSSFISVVGEKNTPKSSKSCGCLSNVDTSDFVLIDKILSGDTGDGVPNVLSGDDTFVNGERQTPLSKKKKQAIIEDLSDGELLYAASWYRNYQRNETLIDLTKTPNDLKNKIVDEFWITVFNEGKTLPYLINNNMKQLIGSVEEFL